ENTAAFTNEAAEKPKASYNASVSDYSALRPASGTAPAYPQRTGNQSGVHAETDSAPFGLPRQAVKPMVSRAFLPIKDGTEEEKPHSQLSIADLYRTAAPDAESPETAAPSHIPEDKPAEHAEAAADGPTVPFRNYRIAGELFNAYILVTEDDRVTVIDKHAAHERLNFERMKARLHGAERTGMLLMLPIVPQLGTAEMDALMSVIDDVEKIGFGITEGDRGSLEITEIPSELDTAEAKAVIERIAGAVLDGTGSPELIGDTAFEKALYQASCKASIKAGRVYPEGYNEALVAQLMAHPEITYCPHGRPVAFVMTKSEFDRRFLRI
ncbi:MAG: hypothetical protein MJ137_06645, partial [Clostridia bacterium]|nr:hypothetical protein [Clostridia bacterium]